MNHTDTIVIGAGQAGLALSRCLTGAGRDHVVLERGRLAERWRSERWDSLRLLTPNWANRLPGWAYRGPSPDGFMTVPDFVTYLQSYAGSFAAPVQEETVVTAVRLLADGYRVDTNHGPWRARNVVIATGVEGHPAVPSMADDLAPSIHQVSPTRYRNPSSLPDGGVLIVGASASGVQLAEELALAGRDVVVAVGNHTRMPRRYRGWDAFRWLEVSGLLDTTIDELPDPAAGPRAPSLQLVGRETHDDIDLNRLQRVGVQLAGHLDGIVGTHATFRDDLAGTIGASEQRLQRTLDVFDTAAAREGLDRDLEAPERPEPIRVPATPTRLDLRDRGISTVLWATGFRRSYPWLHVPVTDGAGEIVQRRGVTAAPGLYVLGLRFQYRRDSNFIGGVGRDAAYVARKIAGACAEEVAA